MSQKTVWCSPCARSFIFFIDASAREHALQYHQTQVQWTQEHGYYIVKPLIEPIISPITTDEIVDNAERPRKEWDEAFHAITSRYIVN